MLVLGVDKNFAFPLAIILLSLRGIHSPAAYKEAQALTDSYDGGTAGI